MNDTRINKLRKDAGLTLEKLASISGLSYVYIRALCYGQRKNPTMDKIVKLAKALGVDPGKLFEDTADGITPEKGGESEKSLK